MRACCLLAMPLALGTVRGAAAQAHDAGIRGGIVIALAPDEFLIAGTEPIVTFEPSGAGEFAVQRVRLHRYR